MTIGMLKLRLGLANARGSIFGNLPALPSGFAFVVDSGGNYLTDTDGNYIITETA